MNYRHSFHAGNHADVLKHSVLIALLAALKRKPKPIFVLDSHAGRGEYSLQSDESRRSDEALGGVHRLRQVAVTSPVLKEYLARLQQFDPAAQTSGTPLQRYPGSPRLILDALESDDRLACCELHAEEFAALRQCIHGDPRVALHHRDGFEALGGLLPPQQTRGLVVIDPPYESRELEFKAVLAGLATVFRRWPVACVAVWYPIKHSIAVNAFLREAARLPTQSAWTAELFINADPSPLRLNGSGMLLMNPPWQLDRDVEAAISELSRHLGEDGSGRSRLSWLRRDGITMPQGGSEVRPAVSGNRFDRR